MASQTPAPLSLEECALLTNSTEDLLTSVKQDPARWQLFIRNVARDASLYPRIIQENSDLQARVLALESTDERLAAVLNQLQQSAGAQRMLENQVRDLTDRLILSQSNGSSSVPRITKSPNHPDPDKFDGDKAKLEAFLAQLNIKLQRNLDHFVREGQDTEQNKLSYAISRLEKDAWAQIEPYVSADKIDFESIEQFREVLKTRFGEVDPIGTANITAEQ